MPQRLLTALAFDNIVGGRRALDDRPLIRRNARLLLFLCLDISARPLLVSILFFYLFISKCVLLFLRVAIEGQWACGAERAQCEGEKCCLRSLSAPGARIYS